MSLKWSVLVVITAGTNGSRVLQMTWPREQEASPSKCTTGSPLWLRSLTQRIKKELIPENLNSEKYFKEARSHFTRGNATTQFPAITNGYGFRDGEEANMVSFTEETARKRRRGDMSKASDELSQYLSEPPAVAIAADVLDWRKANIARYPRLSIMARDYLAVQGTKVEPHELFFSKGDEAHQEQFMLKFISSIIDYDKLVDSGALTLSNAQVCGKHLGSDVIHYHII